MSPLLAISLIWTWHVFWMGVLTYSLGHAAYLHAGSPFRRHPRWIPLFWRVRFPKFWYWPISGRWLITALLLTVTLMMTDVARASWNAWQHDYPIVIPWYSVVIRGLPIVIAPACFYRQWTRGLINDYPKRSTQT